jgi:ribosome maturation factor RimP
VVVKCREKLEGIKNFHGTLVEFITDNGEKTIVVAVSGKDYRIPMGRIAKVHLAEAL